MTVYSWEYGSTEVGLSFTVVYDDQAKTFSVNVLEGHMDLNALWFSDGDRLTEGNTKLSKSDNSLNMNGATQVWEDGSPGSEKITWDLYQKTSSTGISNDGFYLTEGQSRTFVASTAVSDWLSGNIDDAILGIRATSTSTAGGSIKWADAEAVRGNIYTDDVIVGEGDYQTLVGDTSGSMGDYEQGGNDQITGGSGSYNEIVGDAYDTIGGNATGGNDEIRSAADAAEGDHYIFGDSGLLTESAKGGNDRILWTSGGTADISGDAYLIDGNAIGGNDQFKIANLSGSFNVYGDAVEMYGSTRGGDDLLEGGIINSNGEWEITQWYGDAILLTDSAMGGRDFIRGMSGSSFSDVGNVNNLIYGDAYDMQGSAIAGNDTLIGGDYASNAMWGDTQTAGAEVTLGNDRLISGAYADDLMWGDALIYSGLGGADVFVFEANNGVDQIRDFEFGHDKIEIKGITGINGFGDLVVTLAPGVGTGIPDSDSLIDFGSGNTVTVVGVTNLTASDFLFT
jgi:hypothetical protein